MIYVAVGTQKFQFNRLLRAIDDEIARGTINEEVFAQIGNSTYKPIHYSYTNFLSKEEFNSYIRNCDLLITHSGVATIITGLKYKKPIIVLPRLAKYGEHVDDHQVQIAESFAERRLILQSKENGELKRLIDKSKREVFEEYVSQRECMVNTIKEYIKKM